MKILPFLSRRFIWFLIPPAVLLLAALTLWGWLGDVPLTGGENIASAPSTPVAQVAPEAEAPEERSAPEVASRTGPNRGLPEGYRLEPFAAGLRQPAAFDFAPDGRLFVAEQAAGLVTVIRPDGVRLPEPMLRVNTNLSWLEFADGSAYTETGLVGIAVDPRFEENHFVYIYYTKGGRNSFLGDDPGALPVLASTCVVERYTEVENRALDPLEILRISPCTAGWGHVGGRLRFGPDETLFITVGDLGRDADGNLYFPKALPDTDTNWAQFPDRPAGKVLRINRDGTIPEDNPFVGTPGADPAVYALGFRNPFGLAFHPETRQLYLTDNGTHEGDELNLVRPGGNYGWPLALGRAADPRFIDPILEYPSPSIAPTGLEFYNGDTPPELKGALFMCQVNRGGQIHLIRLATPAYDSVVEDRVVGGAATPT